MNIRKSHVIAAGIILVALAVSVVFYPRMPEKMATHWGAEGQVDGYTSKVFGVFFMPVLMTVIALVFAVIPKIDPLKANIEKFRNYYDGFIILFLIFLLAIHYQVILWNLGIRISPNRFLPVAVGLLFFYIGILCDNAKRNWFVGIRTPWTLSSDRVWEKTHKIGGKLFKIAGIVVFAGIFFPDYAMLFIVIPAILVGIYTTIYSCLEYRKENKSFRQI